MSAAVTASLPLWPDKGSDPLRPGIGEPTADDVVAALSPLNRRRRVEALVEQAHRILAEALAAHLGGRELVGVCLLWSGGNDSNVLAHLMRSHATHVVHANTGIGVEETRQHVRAHAAAWGLPLIEKHPPEGSAYRDYVREHGFPGPAQHHRMYQRLKERALRQARGELVSNGRRQRVVFLAGRRRAESARRSGKAGGEPIPVYEREDSVIWVSPLVMWTKLDLNTYRSMHSDVPHNEVCDHLHMSGECLCGSYAKPGELDMIRDFYPDTAAEIDALAAEARANGVPGQRCQWGWGATRGSPTDASQPVGRLCTSCTGPATLLSLVPAPDIDTAPDDQPRPTSEPERHEDMTPAVVRPLRDDMPPALRTAWTADELMAADFPEPKWAVHGVICEGVNLIAGPPKVGKSWLSLGLGLAIAGGEPAFGSIATTAGPVLYLALEDTARRLQSRMGKLLAGKPAPRGLTLATECPPLPDGGDKAIAGWLDRNPDARLVVIDVLAKVRGHESANGSQYAADYAAIGRIKRIADHHGVAVLVVTHVRKMGSDDFLQTVSGTNGIAGAADAVLVLQRGRNNADGQLHVTGRDVEEQEYALSFDPTHGAWNMLDGPAIDHLVGDTRATILRYLRDHPASTPKIIASAAELPYDNVKRTCARMADAGQLTKDGTGRYFVPLRGDTGPLSPMSPVSPNYP